MSLITLHNKNIGSITWQHMHACPYSVHNRVDIWQINVNAHLTNIETLKEILNPSELSRASKYLRDADRNRFIVSRNGLRNILGQYTGKKPLDIEFKSGSNQKPYIDFPIHFNLSDSAENIIIAIAGSEIGVDVEFIKPDFSYDSIINSHFNAKVIEYIKETDSPNRFFTLWTRKESILKATGVGLIEHLNSINALDGVKTIDGDLLSTRNNWLLSTFMLNENYPVTIAADPLVKNFHFYNYQL
jgi:4'-phosphopantetheinyl transferase